MDKLKAILGLVFALATPANLTSAKAIVTALVALGSIRKDDGALVTVEELDALWDAAEANLRTLGDEARASQAAIGK